MQTHSDDVTVQRRAVIGQSGMTQTYAGPRLDGLSNAHLVNERENVFFFLNLCQRN